MKSFPSKWNRGDFDPVVLPKATTGHCRNYLKCKQFNVELANGYCITCWDTGRDIKDARQEARERRWEDLKV